MKTIKKITIAFSAIALTALALSACSSDDSGTGPNGGYSTPTNLSGGIVYNLSVNEANHTLIVSTKREIGECVLVNDEPQWIDEGVKDYADTNVYEIKGDTLILHDYDEEDDHDYKTYYVGNNGGSLYGTWEQLSCDEEARICQLNPFTMTIITFTQTTATAYYILRDNADFIKSDIAYFVVKALLDGSYYDDIYVSDFDDQDYADTNFPAFLLENNIQYQTINNKQASIVINGQVYTLNISTTEESLNFRRFEASVTTGSTTCSVNDIVDPITKVTCNRNNIYDMSNFHECGTEFTSDSIVYKQLIHDNRISNIENFRTCINSISQKPYTPSALYKKSAEKISHTKKKSWFSNLK